MSDAIEPAIVAAVDAATKAAYAATGNQSIKTLIALAHAYAGWREACLRDARTIEIDPMMAPLVAQVDAIIAGLLAPYAAAAEAERVDGAIIREVEELTAVTRTFSVPSKGAA